jgi:hypothetical protein
LNHKNSLKIAKTKSDSELFTILVNSSDGYDDCWDPFFQLLDSYWQDLNVEIILNTGIKSYKNQRFPSLVCSQVEKSFKKKPTWSECLIEVLGRVRTPLVLYFQEDYFINKKVDVDRVMLAAEHMIKNNISHVGLTPHGSYGPYLEYKDSRFKEIRQNAKYRISTQAGLWRVKDLRSYLNEAENGWMFEIFGTWRSRNNCDKFLIMDDSLECNNPVIDYKHTGIIKGKWYREIVSDFLENKIEVDFSKRGFYVPRNSLLHKLDVLKKLSENVPHALKQLILK